MTMTSVVDGRTHVVSPVAFDDGIWAGRGRYQAQCGSEVIVAALASAPGPACQRCAQFDDEQAEPETSRLAAALATLTRVVGWSRTAAVPTTVSVRCATGGGRSPSDAVRR
jgi:hypothetical protein